MQQFKAKDLRWYLLRLCSKACKIFPNYIDTQSRLYMYPMSPHRNAIVESLYHSYSCFEIHPRVVFVSRLVRIAIQGLFRTSNFRFPIDKIECRIPTFPLANWVANWLAFRRRTRHQFIIVAIGLTCQPEWWRRSTLKGVANPTKLDVCPAWPVCPNNSQLISRQAWRNEAQSPAISRRDYGPFRRFYLVRKHLRTNFWALTGPPLLLLLCLLPCPLALWPETSCMPIGLQFAALSRRMGGWCLVAGVNAH